MRDSAGVPDDQAARGAPQAVVSPGSRRAVSDFVRAGFSGQPVFSTTARGVEFAIAAVTVGARVMLLLQMSASVGSGFAVSPRPGLYAVFVAIGVGWSVAYAAVCVRRRSPVPPFVARADILVAGVCLVLQPAVVPTGQHFDSWVNWAYVYGLNVLSASGCARISRIELTCGVGLIATLYLLTRWSEADVAHTAVLSNVVSMFVFPVLSRLFGGYLRRLGRDADQARAVAAATAAAAERERHQLLLHDSATILRLIAEGALPPEVDLAVRRQAASESNRIRSFLTGTVAIRDELMLTQVISQAVQAFPDLPIDVVADLAGAVRLEAGQAGAVRLALTGLLSNVRVHADATHVVVHGDWDDADAEWEIVVRDDGVGFDVDTTPEGFGLAIQVRKALAAQDVSSLVRSTPGEGTVAVLRGRLDGEEVR